MRGLQERLKADLTAALGTHDRPAITALRTALAAVSNAEAVPGSDDYQEPVIGRLNEVPRRDLTDGEIAEILRAEAAERTSAIDEYEALGLREHADRLHAELAVLHRYLE